MQVRKSVLVLALAVLASPAVSTARADDRETASLPVKRFMKVSDTLYRGAQPDVDGFRALKDLGIRTIVSLREDPDEQALVESLGMTFIHIPVAFKVFGGDLPDQAVRRFFTVVDDAANGPVFVHCRRGADRTGSFVALYRIVRQRWSLERAYEEARDVGMRWWYTDVKDELRDWGRTLTSVATTGAQ